MWGGWSGAHALFEGFVAGVSSCRAVPPHPLGIEHLALPPRRLYSLLLELILRVRGLHIVPRRRRLRAEQDARPLRRLGCNCSAHGGVVDPPRTGQRWVKGRGVARLLRVRPARPRYLHIYLVCHRRAA